MKCRGLRVIVVSVAAIGLLIALSPAVAASLRCTHGLVKTGDQAVEVRAACGAPSFVDPWIAGPGLAYGAAASMEAWTYNRGPSQLLRILIFRDGELIRMRTDGHGFRERRGASGCQPTDIVEHISKYRLLQMCGQPAQQSGLFVFSSRRRLGDGRHVFRRHSGVPVYRERWIYNFGDNRLLREVTLENGKVVAIDTLGRGFDE